MTQALQRHNAPAAFLQLGSCRWLRCGLWSAWGVGLLAALYSGWAAHWPARSILIFLVLPLSAWGIGSYLRSIPRGILSWTGVQWHWRMQALDTGGIPAVRVTQEGWPVVLEPVWDVQDAVLLRWRRESSSPLPGKAAGWLWAERPAGMASSAWLAFRRAVYSPARHQEPVLGMADR